MDALRADISAELSNRASHGLSFSPAAPSVSPPADLLSAEDWNEFGQHVGVSCNGDSPCEFRFFVQPKTRAQTLRDSMVNEGYVQLDDWTDTAWLDGVSAKFCAAIDRLDAAGLPAVFLLAFDEVWAVTNSLKSVLAPVFGHDLTFDFYVFNVKPGGSGWAMHRERAGADAKSSFDHINNHGLPSYNTVWLALTDATPSTSCMYALPASADSEYSCSVDDPPSAKTDDADIHAIVAEKHQQIRALPVRRGTALVWSHRLIHWGSAHGGAPSDRKTLAFALADPAFEPPLLRKGGDGPLPHIHARLAIIAHLLVRYHHEASHPAKLWPSTLLQALTLLHECADYLSDAALEWYSRSKERASPVAQGSVLQLNLVALHNEHVSVAVNGGGSSGGGGGTIDAEDVARKTKEIVVRLATYIVSTRKLTANDELAEIAKQPSSSAKQQQQQQQPPIVKVAQQQPQPQPPPVVEKKTAPAPAPAKQAAQKPVSNGAPKPAVAPPPPPASFVYDEVD